jgi:hypothetical protein
MARTMRALLAELEPGTFEKACVKLLHGLHFRELKLARRSKEGPTLTARKKDGSLELRFAVRILRGPAPVERRHIQELRRDLQSHGANVGLIVSPGEVRGEARGEAVGPGPLVFLWCGDSLAERFFEAQVGVTVTTLELFSMDPDFFDRAHADALESQQRREERQRERGEAEAPPPAASAPAAPERETEAPPPPEVAVADSEQDPGDDEEQGDDEEGPEEEGAESSVEGAPGAGSEGRKRRRRRRRRRRGGAGRPEGQLPGAQAASPEPGSAPAIAGAAEAQLPHPPPPPDPPGETS